MNKEIFKEILEILEQLKKQLASTNDTDDTDTADDTIPMLCQALDTKQAELKNDTNLLGISKDTITVNTDDLKHLIQLMTDEMLLYQLEMDRLKQEMNKLKKLQEQQNDTLEALKYTQYIIEEKRNEVTAKIYKLDEVARNIQAYITKRANKFFNEYVKELVEKADREERERIRAEYIKQLPDERAEDERNIQRIMRDLDDDLCL